jgi:putative hydrolase
MVAERLREAADLLERQGANPFRVGAYRKASGEIMAQEFDVRSLFDTGGVEGLVALPHIGKGIAAVIVELFTTGRWSLLERLRGDAAPEKLFTAIPGVGPRLAEEIHDSLHIDSLEGLEAAVRDGRLRDVPGIGPRRAAAIGASLGLMLRRVPRRSPPVRNGPAVSLLLEVDSEYRTRAGEGSLPTISPRRFNPDGSFHIPVLHTTRGSLHFTALFSNTARAHELGRTSDWVVIYFYDDHQREGQHTVVTETAGPLTGRRVVRGREHECREWYGQQP